MRSVIAFLVAPLIVAVGWSTYAFFGTRPFSDRALEFLVSAAIWYMYGALFTALFAVPLFLILKRFQSVSGWTSAIAGVAISGVSTSLLPTIKPLQVAWMCILGALAGFGFWLFVKSEKCPATPLERIRAK